MQPSAITPVWALHETSNSMLAVAKGVLIAATSDNVQPLALLVTEAFGNTLAVCTQTQLIVEKEASKSYKSHVLKFLKAQVGYAAGDAASHLSSTSAGVRFLSLAAALLCTSSSFTAAEALNSMIATTARRDELLPTVTQLHDLLKALDYKLARVGFADSIIGWENFIAHHPEWVGSSGKTDDVPSLQPAAEVLCVLVDAFRTIERIGDGSAVLIKAMICAPWIIAFVKWCLGVPPNIVLENGNSLLEQPTSKVTVQIGLTWSATVTVEILRDINGPAELWSGDNFPTDGNGGIWTGMISIRNFGSWRLRGYGLDAGHGYSALCQALSYSLKLVKGSLAIVPPDSPYIPPTLLKTLVTIKPAHISKEHIPYKPECWPSDRDLYSLMAAFIGLDVETTELPVLRHGNILNLPVIDTYIKSLEKACGCRRCTGDASQPNQCSIDLFKDSIVALTREILALSLFDSVDSILVAKGSNFYASFITSFNKAIHGILFENAASSCKITDIFDNVLALLGHKTSQDFNKGKDTSHVWVASASRGQVVYPQYLESAVPHDRALLMLGGGPGVIAYADTRYNFVVAPSMGSMPKVISHGDIPVQKTQNLLPNEKLAWQVTEQDGYLMLGFGLSTSFKGFNPMRVLSTAAQSLFITSCPHAQESPLEAEDDMSVFITPRYDMFAQSIESTAPQLSVKTPIVAVSGDDSLRFFALGGGVPAVVRQGACLQCCIDICRSTGLSHVIA